MQRRDSLKLMALASMAAGFTWVPEDVTRVQKHLGSQRADQIDASFAPEFFSEHEWETVRVLVDLIIPADDRSGSATAAGVPEFMDFMMMDRPTMQVPMRGGLAWLDYQCQKRFGKAFMACDYNQRMAMLDEIAWPDLAKPELSQGVAFFNSFRDLTASGFWSSKMGIEDLQYIGNTVVPEWNGCPSEVLERLGVSYDGE
ncbi:MAG: gluconate 2-dehydrogenase subunit 3 family protein [Rhodothermales bacterium]